MGLLDEAIRDHLELKRRAGADPAEIAHAERAALAPVFPDEPQAASADEDVTEQVPRRVVAADDGVAAPATAGESGEPIADPSEETVEIDMEAVLAADDARGATATPVAAAPAAADADGFEWEDPGALAHDADAEGPPEQIPGQERMSLE